MFLAPTSFRYLQIKLRNFRIFCFLCPTMIFNWNWTLYFVHDALQNIFLSILALYFSFTSTTPLKSRYRCDMSNPTRNRLRKRRQYRRLKLKYHKNSYGGIQVRTKKAEKATWRKKSSWNGISSHSTSLSGGRGGGGYSFMFIVKLLAVLLRNS